MVLEFLLFAIAAHASGVETVVTLDNGEFNLPLYTPRYNGRWEQPSVAQEIVAGIARIRGENPNVFTYLPPGRTPSRPGAPHAVEPRLAGCEGPAEAPGDPCWCGPADRCWTQIGPNYHPSASTSLYLTATAVRERLPGGRPRIEVHLADLFEEDPSTATDPAWSDRCVTFDGTRKAVRGLVRLPEGESLDHLAVGVLRVRVDPPPPGGSWGNTYELRPDRGDCWSGQRGLPWESLRSPVDLAMAVVVLGVDTEAHSGEFDAFLDGLAVQMSSADLRLELARLREPAAVHTVEATVPLEDPFFWKVPPPPVPPHLPCSEPVADVRLESDGHPVEPLAVGTDCSGELTLRLHPDGLRHEFVREAGLQRRSDRLTITGGIELRSPVEPLLARAAELQAHATGGDRPLPFWDALVRAFELDAPTARNPVWTPWTTRVQVQGLVVTGVDDRPFGLALLGALATALAAASGIWTLMVRSEAARSIRSHWERNVGPGADPLLQRPIATILAEAQEELRLGRTRRLVAALLVGALAAGGAFWLLMWLHTAKLAQLAGIVHG